MSLSDYRKAIREPLQEDLERLANVIQSLAKVASVDAPVEVARSIVLEAFMLGRESVQREAEEFLTQLAEAAPTPQKETEE